MGFKIFNCHARDSANDLSTLNRQVFLTKTSLRYIYRNVKKKGMIQYEYHYSNLNYRLSYLINILTLQICLNFSLLNSVFFYLHLTELQNNNIQHLIQDNEHNSLSLKELSKQFSFILNLWHSFLFGIACVYLAVNTLDFMVYWRQTLNLIKT